MLAHVDVGVAASCHSPAWIAWAEARFGPARERTLADDAALLARTSTTHERLARAQILAWVWRDTSRVRAAIARDLASLTDRDVDDASALSWAQRAGPDAEILRATAELELDFFAARAPVDLDEIARAIAAVTLAAPALEGAEVLLARPLPRRGRAFGGARRSIVVGVPGVAGAEVEHVAWQAAHEATVLESAQREATFEAIERRALGLMRSRARGAGLAGGHARWLATLDLRALGSIPDVDDVAE
ncbi:MAG: hypothetical protein KF819_35955 [Labilithrix sp.]|nr:hypothetical protein [Labilithrix sp.]